MPDRETSQPTKSRSKFQLLQTFTWFYSNGKICRHPIHLSVKYYRRGIENEYHPIYSPHQQGSSSRKDTGKRQRAPHNIETVREHKQPKVILCLKISTEIQ
eukprot:TRINITY_DN3435_c0_g1_i1.p1 TRINITY_DN3435_c0_g1~~TRINITY_DN3435_c0_g1_i1.p1  ORF type:complete len:101 (-),score=12.65 TRINITY_DN3435_c0_g1_i1:276-578(-)